MITRIGSASPRLRARIAGVLYLIIFIAAPSGAENATLANMTITMACDACVAVLFYWEQFVEIPIGCRHSGFLTPTLTCFSGVLLQALVVLVPWSSDWPRGLMLVPGGLWSNRF
jgi:hypothetical protein